MTDPSPAPRSIAVVLGAGGTLGRAISVALSGRGLRVVGVGRRADPPPDLLAAVPDVAWCEADLSDEAGGARVAELVDGPVRMIVQAAGLPAGGSLAELDLALIGVAMSTKLGGWLRVVRALDDRLVAGSRLVALGGHYGAEPSPHAPLAGLTNAALANLVRQMSAVYGPRAVTVHLVSPGPVESERMQRIATVTAAREGGTADAVLDTYRAGSPLGRLTTAAEVAWAVALLLDDEAAALHGSTLWLDLGRRHGIG